MGAEEMWARGSEDVQVPNSTQIFSEATTNSIAGHEGIVTICAWVGEYD